MQHQHPKRRRRLPQLGGDRATRAAIPVRVALRVRVAGGVAGGIPRDPSWCACRVSPCIPIAPPTAHPSCTGHAQDKSSFCARRFDGTFCQLAIDDVGNHSAAGHTAGICGLLADGCAPSYRNHLLTEASARCEAQRQPPVACGKAAAAAYHSEVQRCSAVHAVTHAAVCGPRLERPAPPAACRPNTCGHSPAPVVALAGLSPAGLAAARDGRRGDRPHAAAERVAQHRGGARPRYPLRPLRPRPGQRRRGGYTYPRSPPG
eukprot:scaffold110920_cov48-Phaeocystis_antarctica.AAC.2